MAGVVLGPEWLSVPASQLSRTTDDGLWRFGFPYRHYEVEVLLAGDDRGPDPEWLSLAERVCAQVDRFVAEATAYLRAFVDGSRFDCPGDWSLEWLEFGRDAHSNMQRPFELVFVLDEDTYGGWGVLFADAGEPVGYWPNQFRRFAR
jgi:hypothetical protein